MLQDGCLGVVDKYFGWDTAKKLEGVLMGLEEVFGSLFEAELDVAQAAVAKHHDKEREPSSCGADAHRAGAAPIDLSAFARSKGQRQKSRRMHPVKLVGDHCCPEASPCSIIWRRTALRGSVWP